jgi:hypothetical protein
MSCKNPNYTVIKDGVIQSQNVCIHEVFKAIQAAGIGIGRGEADRVAEILNGYPILVDGVRTSYLDHLRMQQRWIDIRQIECMTTEEELERPWILNR